MRPSVKRHRLKVRRVAGAPPGKEATKPKESYHRIHRLKRRRMVSRHPSWQSDQGCPNYPRSYLDKSLTDDGEEASSHGTDLGGGRGER